MIELANYCPWKEHLYDLEAEVGIEGQIKFCLYQVGLYWSRRENA